MATPFREPSADERYNQIAVRQYRPAFVPEVGGMLVVQLPGETMRVPVESVLDPDAVIVKLDSPPISRMHTFRFGDKVGARRRVKDGRDTWEVQNDRDFLTEQQRIVQASRAKRPTPKVTPVQAAPKAAEKPPEAPPSKTNRKNPVAKPVKKATKKGKAK